MYVHMNACSYDGEKGRNKRPLLSDPWLGDFNAGFLPQLFFVKGFRKFFLLRSNKASEKVGISVLSRKWGLYYRCHRKDTG